MLRNLINDLESALANVRATDLLPGMSTGRAPTLDDSASLSQWLPYRAYLEDHQIFVNRDALGFCLEVRPQSGADEDMARVLPPLYEFRIRRRVFRWYAELRAVDEAVGRRPAADLLAELDALEANVARVTVPLSYADELYSLRSHVDMVRQKLQAAPAA